jgi:predicted Zn-dependent peptidase
LAGDDLAQRFYQCALPGGLTLVAEAMPNVRSAAMTLLIPAGVANDPAGACGAATVLAEWVLRGAGSRNSRELSDHLDSLGLQRSSGVGVYHTNFNCAAVASRVLDGLSVYADIVRRPQFPDEGFEAARDLTLQSLAGIDDEPRHKVLVKLRETHVPGLAGRNPLGKKDDLRNLSLAACKAEHARRYLATGSILALAGDLDFDSLRSRIDADWRDFTGTPPPPADAPQPPATTCFEFQDSEQANIGLAYPSVPETHEDYYAARVAAEVLGGGMSGRLFTELREKKALVYSVWAGFNGMKDRGSILGYAGTSTSRAQDTLDAFVSELRRLSKGVTPAELSRAKIGLKANLIMEGESTSSRASAIAYDWFMRGRIRTMEEIESGIDQVSLDRVNAYLKNHPPEPLTIVVVGAKELKVPL